MLQVCEEAMLLGEKKLFNIAVAVMEKGWKRKGLHWVGSGAEPTMLKAIHFREHLVGSSLPNYVLPVLKRVSESLKLH